MERIRVEASKSYDVLIGGGILGSLGERCKALFKGKSAVIISDTNTKKLFSEAATSSLQKEGFSVYEFTVPSGENSKCAENYIKILNFLAERKLTRADFIVALGGGVVGDLSGFVAGSFLRGIPFVQVPTTLLSAVDSSVGGKTGINLDSGKNLAGLFYQPSLVLCDTDIISALPDAIFAEGLSEVIKYGAIRNEKIFDLIKGGARKNLGTLIAECVKIKRDIVKNDEFDRGERQLLNFGHTPAHAIEKCSGYSISHGAAVAIGMCIMARAAEKLGLCEDGISDEISALCKLSGLPTACEFTEEELFEVALSDKKANGTEICLVVPKKRGESVLLKVAQSEVLSFFEKGLER